jgi:hypothetical protein
LINGNDTDYSFKNAINEKYKALRQYIWKPIDDDSLDDMWNQEWTLWGMFWSLFWAWDFTDYLTIDNARYSWLFGWWNYWYKNTKEDNISDDAARYREIEEWDSNESSQSFSDMASSRTKNK